MTGPHFRSIAAAARSAVERVHGEAIRILPQDRTAGPNGIRSSSTTRLAFDASACFWQEAERVDRDMRDAFRSGNIASVNRSGRLMASMAGIAGPDGQLAQIGDVILRADGDRRYEITAIDPDGIGHFDLALAAARTPAP